MMKYYAIIFITITLMVVNCSSRSFTTTNIPKNSYNMDSVNVFSPQFSGTVFNQYNTGELKNIGKIKFGRLDENWVLLHKNGIIKKMITYENGFIVSDVKDFYETGTIKSEIIYETKTSDIHSYQKKNEWYSNGIKKTKIERDLNLQVIKNISWDSIGNQTSFYDNSGNSILKISYYEKGIEKERIYKDNKAMTLRKKYSDSIGNIISEELHSLHNNGTLHKKFYPNGKLKSTGYKKLKSQKGPIGDSKQNKFEVKNGIWHYWNSDGTKSKDITYRYGENFGAIVEYENNQISMIEEIRFNKNYGIKINYKDGKEINRILYYSRDSVNINVNTLFTVSNNNRDELDIRNTVLGFYHKIHPKLKRFNTRASYPKGIVIIEMKILPSGDIKSCKVIESEFEDEDAINRVVIAMSKWKFKKIETGSVTVTYPIEFF